MQVKTWARRVCSIRAIQAVPPVSPSCPIWTLNHWTTSAGSETLVVWMAPDSSSAFHCMAHAARPENSSWVVLTFSNQLPSSSKSSEFPAIWALMVSSSSLDGQDDPIAGGCGQGFRFLLGHIRLLSVGRFRRPLQVQGQQALQDVHVAQAIGPAVGGGYGGVQRRVVVGQPGRPLVVEVGQRPLL